MADNSDLPGPTSSYRENTGAPFIYFDMAPTFGVLMGAIQVELAARLITPGDDGATIINFMTCGRIRCSPEAARSLREALDKSLAMLEQPQEAPAGAAIN